MVRKTDTSLTFNRAQTQSAFDQLGDEPIKAIKKKLKRPGKDEFLRDVLERVGKTPGSSQSVSLKAVREAVVKVLTKVQTDLGEGQGKGKARIIDLNTVSSNVGKTAANLIVLVDESWRTGAIELRKKMPVDEALARKVATVYEEIGDDYDVDVVVDLCRQFHADFSSRTLDALHMEFGSGDGGRKGGTKGILPERADLQARAYEKRLGVEAEVLDGVFDSVGRDPEAVVKAMQRRGYEDFVESRIPFMTMRFEHLRRHLVIDVDLAKEVAEVYVQLGLDAETPRVVEIMQERYDNFTDATLKSLMKKASTKKFLPSRNELNKARSARDVLNEAIETAKLWKKTGGDDAAIVEGMIALGYEAFAPNRIDYLRREMAKRDEVPPEAVIPRAEWSRGGNRSAMQPSRELALVVAKILDELGPIEAADDRIVAKRARVLVGKGFSIRLLKDIWADPKLKKLLPSRDALFAAKRQAEYDAEAEVIKEVMTEVGDDRKKITRAMKRRGYKEFYPGRVDVVRAESGHILGLSRKRRTKAEYDVLAKQVRAFVKANPEVNLGQICDEFDISYRVVGSVVDNYGIEVKAASGKKKLKRADPLQRLFILRAILDHPTWPAAKLCRSLSGTPAFAERYGKITNTALGQYISDVLNQEIPDWYTFRRQQVTRVLVEEIKAARKGQPLEATTKDLQGKYEGGPVHSYVYQDLRKAWDANPELYPEAADLRDEDGDINWKGRGLRDTTPTRAMPGQYDEAFAEYVSWFYQQGASTTDVKMMVTVFDPKFDDDALESLRKAFPGHQLHDDAHTLAPASAPTPAARDVQGKVFRYLSDHPKAKVAEVAKALGLRSSQVTMPLRKAKAALSEVGHVVSAQDVAQIVTAVRQVEPGKDLAAVRKTLLSDPEFKARNPARTLTHAAFVSLVRQHVPEAGNWELFELQRMVEVLEDIRDDNPDVSSDSQLFRLARKRHKGMPTYAVFEQRIRPKMDSSLSALPMLRDFLGEDGKLHFGDAVERVTLNESLAAIIAEHVEAVDYRVASSVGALLDAINSDERVMFDYPEVSLATVRLAHDKYPHLVDLVDDPRENPEVFSLAQRASGLMAAGEAADEVVKITDLEKFLRVGDREINRAIEAYPDKFWFYRKNTEITPAIARRIGEVVREIPVGTSIEDAAEFLQRSGRLPRTMKITKTTIPNAHKKFPDLVPNLTEQSKQRYEVALARDLFTMDDFFSRDIVIELLERRFEKNVMSARWLKSDVFPRWQKMLDDGNAPAWLRAIAPDGQVATFGLGQRREDFPEPGR